MVNFGKDKIKLQEHLYICDKYPDPGWSRYNDCDPKWDNYRDRCKYIIDKVDKSPILDIGCAEGVMCIELAKKGFKNIIGVDVSKKTVKKADDILKKIQGMANRITYKVAWAEHLPFKDREFKTVIMTEVLEHVFDLGLSIREADRVLDNNGRIIVSVPSRGEVALAHVRTFKYRKDFMSLFPCYYQWGELIFIRRRFHRKWLVGYAKKKANY